MGSGQGSLALFPHLSRPQGLAGMGGPSLEPALIPPQPVQAGKLSHKGLLLTQSQLLVRAGLGVGVRAHGPRVPEIFTAGPAYLDGRYETQNSNKGG